MKLPIKKLSDHQRRTRIFKWVEFFFFKKRINLVKGILGLCNSYWERNFILKSMMEMGLGRTIRGCTLTKEELDKYKL